MTITGIVLFHILPAAAVILLVAAVLTEYRRDRIPILLYHRLISKSAAQRGEVPDDEMIWVCYDTVFAEQMNYLNRAGYTTLDMDDYVAIRSGGSPRPPKPVIITFDDGYESNHRYAFPALRANNQKAVIFVAPEPDQHTRDLVAGVDDFLSNEQMKELAENGVSIQSHTLTHCVLSELDDERVTHELEESRQRLEAATGKTVRHFAVPRAGYSRRVRKLVKQVGYLTTCCNNKGSANGSSDMWALPRIVIERDMNVGEFARALTPRTGAVLRVIGNIKRIPERVGGATFATRIRNALYESPFRRLFETRNLKKFIAACGLLYLVASILFTWYLLTR